MRSLGVHRLLATLPPAIARKPPSGLRAREMKVPNRCGKPPQVTPDGRPASAPRLNERGRCHRARSCRLYGQSPVFARGRPTTRSAQRDKIGASESTPHKRTSVDNADTSACILRKRRTADKIDTAGSSLRMCRVDRIDTAGSTPRTRTVDKIGGAGRTLRKRAGSRIRSGESRRNRRSRANRRSRNTAGPNQTIEPWREWPPQLRDSRQGPPVLCTF
jgi:hypothetical protein